MNPDDGELRPEDFFIVTEADIRSLDFAMSLRPDDIDYSPLYLD